MRSAALVNLQMSVTAFTFNDWSYGISYNTYYARKLMDGDFTTSNSFKVNDGNYFVVSLG